MDEVFKKYGLAASFIATMLRLFYAGERSEAKPLKLDEATSLQTLALAARFAEIMGGGSVTTETFIERLRGIAGEPSHPVELREDYTEVTSSGPGATKLCTYFPYPGGGTWWCHTIYSVKA